MALIKCKECDQQVSNTAKLCPHCGAKVPDQHLPGWFTLLILAGAGVFIWYEAAKVTAPPPSGPNPATAISVLPETLADAYDANEAAANAAYKGKLLRVTGLVEAISKNVTDDTVLRLQARGRFLGIQAELNKSEEAKAIGLSKGQTVTLVCIGGGEVLGVPFLDDCRIQ